MKTTLLMKTEFDAKGYLVIPGVFSSPELEQITAVLEHADTTGASFRKSGALFAIRRFLEELPGIRPLVFKEPFKALIRHYAGPGYFISKSIYFDKPGLSNWFVAYHQDLTISVNQKKRCRALVPGL